MRTLIANAAARGDTAAHQGYHFKLQLSQDPQKHKTFWVRCTASSSSGGGGGGSTGGSGGANAGGGSTAGGSTSGASASGTSGATGGTSVSSTPAGLAQTGGGQLLAATAVAGLILLLAGLGTLFRFVGARR